MRIWIYLLGAWFATALPAQAAMCVDDGTDSRVRPLVDTHLLPPWPAVSQKLGERGVSVLTVVIDKFGVPVEVALKETSGSPRLDDAAILTVRDQWRWEAPPPECQADGIRTQVRVIWNLRGPRSPIDAMSVIYADGEDYPQVARNLKEEGVTAISIFISPSGAMMQSRVEDSSGFEDLDAAAMAMVARWKYQPAAINGKPSPAYTGVRVAFVLKGPADPRAIAP